MGSPIQKSFKEKKEEKNQTNQASWKIPNQNNPQTHHFCTGDIEESAVQIQFFALCAHLNLTLIHGEDVVGCTACVMYTKGGML